MAAQAAIHDQSQEKFHSRRCGGARVLGK